ncbi:unnamed protein product [Sphenostylis stenocarpa]|uniref:Uncharacterized protein n=1 Tax=Sphenostylis stenocarpa TaxID=92480 RepID=A0AA86RMM8_9FABA|nr:unnamed protein product [Sphenostylis stenocarpa]
MATSKTMALKKSCYIRKWKIVKKPRSKIKRIPRRNLIHYKDSRVLETLNEEKECCVGRTSIEEGKKEFCENHSNNNELDNPIESFVDFEIPGDIPDLDSLNSFYYDLNFFKNIPMDFESSCEEIIKTHYSQSNDEEDYSSMSIADYVINSWRYSKHGPIKKKN